MKPESQPQQEKPIGRPSDYSDALADAICDRLMLGESMATICTDDAMPGESTVYRWLPLHAYFRERLAGAREGQAERMISEILDIADDTSGDTEYGDAGPRPNTEWISRSKLRVEARFKLMALLAPKKYGTKLDLTSGGDKLGATDYTKLSKEALSEILHATAPEAQ